MKNVNIQLKEKFFKFRFIGFKDQRMSYHNLANVFFLAEIESNKYCFFPLLGKFSCSLAHWEKIIA